MRETAAARNWNYHNGRKKMNGSKVRVLRSVESNEIQIDKHIPIPAKGWGKYPFRRMEVGDSCFVAGAKSTGIAAGYHYLRPKKFTVRSVTEKGVKGVRVWRIA